MTAPRTMRHADRAHGPARYTPAAMSDGTATTSRGTGRRRARGSSCRRTTRPRTCPASRPRSSRRCRARRCSSSTTARPTAPASSPTQLAADDPRVRVRHRPAKQGLGRAYLDGFGVALDGGAAIVVQMDADWSHDPAALPALLAPIAGGRRGPRHRVALHAGRRRRRLGPRPADHLARRQPVRADRAGARARTTSPAASRPGGRRRSRRSRSTASTPAATCSRSR